MGTRHTLWAVVAILAVAALLAFAGAAQAGHHEDRGEPQVSDPEGDATEYNSEFAAAQADRSCFVSRTVNQACGETVRPALSEAPRAGGFPADPSLDILSVTLWETPEALKVTLELAQIDDGWQGFEREDGPFGPQQARLDVSWYNDGDGGCEERVVVFGPDDAAYLNGEDHCGDAAGTPENPWDRGCTYAYRCWVEVPLEVEPGSPGFITWNVPREALVNGDKDWTLHDVSAQTVLFPGSTLSSGCLVCWGVYAPGQSEGGWIIGWAYEVDGTDQGGPFTFASDPEPWTAPDPEAPMATGWEVEEPQLHVLTYDIEETPETLRFVTTLEHVDPDPGSTVLFAEFALPTKHILSFSVFGETDEWNQGEGEGYNAHAEYFEPKAGVLSDDYHWVSVPVDVAVTPGDPGTIAVTVDRSYLPRIEAGGLSKLNYLLSSDSDTVGVEYVHVDEAEAGGWAGTAKTDDGEWGGVGASLYRFLHDTPSHVLDTFVRVSDATGDTVGPDPAFDASLQARFDVTYLEARAVDADETHLTIGVSDLSRATVPRGYDGMFYALAVQDGERTTMVGYHKAARASAGTFLCAPDITVLTETQRDPTEAVWTLIDGLVSAPPGGGGGGEGGPGAITFHVPNACFGDEAMDPSGERIGFDRFAAGTYLVRSGAGGLTQGTVYEVDAAESDGPVSLVIPDDADIEPVGWYAAPFGVESFWDILGIGLALSLATGGSAVKLRRRRIDKAAIADAKAREDRDVYRAALGRAVAADVDPASDTVLRALRNRLGISKREHAMLELEAGVAAGRGVAGLAEGALFLGKYRIERQLDEGGFARTYLARDEKLARDVVLKVARWDTPKELRRALREARIIARAEHDNIVRVIDVEEVADLGVLVLEYVPGGSLADRLEDGPLPLDDALAVADGVLAGLEAAHGEGIVHRDVKPGNILLTRDGRAKLVDFGIARAPEGSGTVTGGTLDGKGAGTLRYMAPEQARGEGTDERSDVYSAGAVLYEMLTGACCLPLDGLREFEARNAVVEAPPRLPIEGVPRRVNKVLERALAKRPGERPQGAAEMRRLLNTATGPA